MVIGRVLAYIFFGFVIMLVGAEGLRFLEGDSAGWISLSQLIEIIMPDEMNAGRLPSIFDFSAILALLIVAIFLFLISRRKIR